MDQQPNATGLPQPAEPTVLPDVATEPHPSGPVLPPDPGAGEGLLQSALPEIQEAAKKVGGFKNLSEIAEQLHQAGKES